MKMLMASTNLSDNKRRSPGGMMFMWDENLRELVSMILKKYGEIKLSSKIIGEDLIKIHLH